jgi:hypothetical protein
MSRDQRFAALEYEIRQEQAASLGRCGRQLEAALEALAAAERALAEHGSVQAAEAREERLQEAAERLWYFTVQREALGLNRHDELYECYGVPELVCRRMGPRPRRR